MYLIFAVSVIVLLLYSYAENPVDLPLLDNAVSKFK